MGVDRIPLVLNEEGREQWIREHAQDISAQEAFNRVQQQISVPQSTSQHTLRPLTSGEWFWTKAKDVAKQAYEGSPLQGLARTVLPSVTGAYTITNLIPNLINLGRTPAGRSILKQVGGQLAKTTFGGTLVNEVGKLTTGKTFGQNVENATNHWVPSFAGEFLNPGFSYGQTINIPNIKDITDIADQLLANTALDKWLAKRNGLDLSFKGAENSEWFANLVKQFGKEPAKQVLKYLRTPEFRNYFLSNKSAYYASKQYKTYNDLKDLFKILPPDIELGGSAALSGQGTVFRPSIGFHDSDFNWKLPDGVKLTDVDRRNVVDFVPVNWTYNPRIHRAQRAGNPFLQKRAVFLFRDHPVDYFLRDVTMKQGPSAPDIRLTHSNIILNAKKNWQRPKDLKDVSWFRRYSKRNPVINVETGENQFAPILFPGKVTSVEGYPNIGFVETYPGSGVSLPVFMNWRGTFNRAPGIKPIMEYQPKVQVATKQYPAVTKVAPFKLRMNDPTKLSKRVSIDEVLDNVEENSVYPNNVHMLDLKDVTLPENYAGSNLLDDVADEVSLEGQYIFDNYAKAMGRRRDYLWYGLPEKFDEGMYGYKHPTKNTFLLGFMDDSGLFLPSHFSPETMRSGAELVEQSAKDPGTPIMFAVTSDLTPMLERLGYNKIAGHRAYFAGHPINKDVLVNDAVTNDMVTHYLKNQLSDGRLDYEGFSDLMQQALDKIKSKTTHNINYKNQNIFIGK